MQLKRPLAGGIRKVLSDEEKDVTGTVLDPTFKEDGVGIIDLPVPVVSLRGIETGDQGLTVSRIKVPYVAGFDLLTGHKVLPTILHRANILLAALQKEEPEDLQPVVNRYYANLVEELGGKNGLLSRNIFGVRMPFSGRAVITPKTCLAYDQIGIPWTMISTMQLHVNDLVLVSRSPVLWEGSVLVLKAIPDHSKTITLNPYCMDLMGADFDGDTVAVFKVPYDDEAQTEATALCAKAVTDHAKWNAEFLMFNAQTDIDWSKPEEDLEYRLQVRFPFTLSPKDVLNPEESDVLCNMEETGCKIIPKDLVNYANGIPVDQFIQDAQEVIGQLIRMKVELGVVGANTDALVQTVYLLNPELLSKAFKLKEHMTQALLDSKHGTDSFNTFEISDVLQRRSAWHPNNLATEEQAVAALVKQGLDEELVRPLIRLLWPEGKGTNDIIRDYMPYCSTTKKASAPALLALMDGERDIGFFGELANTTGFIGDSDAD